MQQRRLPSSLEASPVDAPSRQLTDAQRAFADVVGKELARLWIEQPGVTSHDTGHKTCHQGLRHRSQG